MSQLVRQSLPALAERFSVLFSAYAPPPPQFVLTPGEREEIFQVSDEVAVMFDIHVPRRRWLHYMDMACWMISVRHVADRSAMVPLCIINNLIFFWDDMSDAMATEANKQLAITELGRVCGSYYRSDYAGLVHNGVRRWLDYDTLARTTPLKREMCSKSADSYWKFSLVDSGLAFYFLWACPVYDDDDVTNLVQLLLPAQLSVKPVMVVNDLFSWDKEFAAGEPANFLYGVDLSDEAAFHRAIDDHFEVIREDLDHARLLGLKLSQIIYDMVHGHFLVTMASPRYRPGATEDNAAFMPGITQVVIE